VQQGDYSKFIEVFGGCYDLKMLYPNREVFRISEAIAFYGTCGRYFGHKGNREVAERYLKMISELDPESSQAEIVEKEILLGQMEKFIKGC
jgi:hypothetical protein